MLDILGAIIDARPLRVPLDFGINQRVKLMSFDNETRIRDGAKVKRNTWMKFAKFDGDGKKIAESEFNYFNLDHERDFAISNFATQAAHGINLVQCLAPDKIDEFNRDFTERLEAYGDLEEALSNKKDCKSLPGELFEAVESCIKDVVGDKCPFLNIKVVSDFKTGKYLNLPDGDQFIELYEEGAESKLKITSMELKNRAKASKPETGSISNNGSKPPAKKHLSI